MYIICNSRKTFFTIYSYTSYKIYQVKILRNLCISQSVKCNRYQIAMIIEIFTFQPTQYTLFLHQMYRASGIPTGFSQHTKEARACGHSYPQFNAALLTLAATK